MSETLYATYADPNRARKAANELLAIGVKPEELSLLIQHGDDIQRSDVGVDLEDTRPTTPMRGTEFTKGIDPAGEGLRQLSVPRMERSLDVELNPAQNDYPIGEPGASSYSSAPPAAERDYNKGIESNDYNKDYVADVSDDLTNDSFHDAQRQKEYLEATPSDDSDERSLRFSRGFNALSEDSPEAIKVDPDADAYRDTDPRLKPGATGHDVAHGVAKGAGIGFGVGAVAALVTLLIPGVGLVVGGGTLAAAATALAAGTGAGAIAGGVTNVLKNQGLSDEAAARYAGTYEEGGAILAVTVTNPDNRASIEQILRANGARELETHRAYLS